MKKSYLETMGLRLLLYTAFFAIFSLGGCATQGHLFTHSGKPFIALHHATETAAAVAIADYQLGKGREIDSYKPGALTTVEVLDRGQDGEPSLSAKTIYTFERTNDSLIVSSRRIMTRYINDDEGTEDGSQISYEQQQQDLQAIANKLATIAATSP